MMTWFRSARGAVTLSFAALVSLLVRSYVDTGFILPEDFGHLGMGFAALWVLGWSAITGGWIWALVAAAAGGGRGAWIALLVYALVTALLFGAWSLIRFLAVPAELAVFSASLVTGVLASVSVGFQLSGVRE